MFKQGQVYKAKVELSPNVNGFGRATIIALDSRSIYVQLKCSKGMKVSTGAKIWFVASSANNRFNGLWSSEIRAAKLIDGINCLECGLPRFEQTSQRRGHVRTDINTPMQIEGDEYKDLDGKLVTRNVSRLGLGFAAPADCADRFELEKLILVTYTVGGIMIRNRFRIVNSRLNWLLNRTEIGAEIMDMDTSTVENIERLLVLLGNRPKGTTAQLTDSGSLARWVRAGKDNLSFVKPGVPDKGTPAASDTAGGEIEDDLSSDEFEEFADFEEDVELE